MAFDRDGYTVLRIKLCNFLFEAFKFIIFCFIFLSNLKFFTRVIKLLFNFIGLYFFSTRKNLCTYPQRHSVNSQYNFDLIFLGFKRFPQWFCKLSFKISAKNIFTLGKTQQNNIIFRNIPLFCIVLCNRN